MLDKGQICFDGPWDEFRASDSPVIRPYIELMPALHQTDARRGYSNGKPCRGVLTPRKAGA
jgi:hypothetical protein